MWWRPRWALPGATATKPWVTLPGSFRTLGAGSCREPRQAPAIGEPRDGARPAAASRIPESTGRGRAAGRGLGPDRGPGASRPGAGLVRLSRAGPALAVDRVCPARVDDILARGSPGPGPRLASPGPGRCHDRRDRAESRRPSGGHLAA